MDKKIPLRQCVGCRAMSDKRNMVRVVKSPEGELSIDHKGKANGRGAYICNSVECLAKAIKNKGLERSLKVSVPTEILERLTKELNSEE